MAVFFFFLQLTWHQTSLWHCGRGRGVQRRGVVIWAVGLNAAVCTRTWNGKAGEKLWSKHVQIGNVWNIYDFSESKHLAKHAFVPRVANTCRCEMHCGYAEDAWSGSVRSLHLQRRSAIWIQICKYIFVYRLCSINCDAAKATVWLITCVMRLFTSSLQLLSFVPFIYFIKFKISSLSEELWEFFPPCDQMCNLHAPAPFSQLR